jgi:hypothetical protein
MIASDKRLLVALIAMQFAILMLLMAIFLRAPSQPGYAAMDSNAIESEQVQASASPATRLQVTAELKNTLREIIREELAALPVSAATNGDNTAFQAEAGLSESERQAQETADMVSASIVQQAASAGVWTQADTDALMPHLGRISEQQRLALMDQLYGAINRQEMEIQDFPPL